MWLPTLLLVFAFSSLIPPPVHFLGGLWSHLQGIVSVGLSLLKPDIYEEALNKAFLTCQATRLRHTTEVCWPSTRNIRFFIAPQELPVSPNVLEDLAKENEGKHDKLGRFRPQQQIAIAGNNKDSISSAVKGCGHSFHPSFK